MDQSSLIDETEDDVWESVIIFCGGYKKVAADLWPKLKPETSYTKLKNCFRDEKSERLTWEERKQILRRARDAGCHFGIHKLCTDLLYDIPNPANRERLREETKSQIKIATDHMRDLISRMEKLQG